MRRGGHVFGTDIRRGFDAHAMGKATAAPGNDLRWWVSEGTVSKLDPATGDLDFADARSIWNDSGGVHVDVELQPLGQHVTARYAGIQAGDVTIFAPIRPGDIVLVALPDGSTVRPVIVGILHSRSKRQPVENGRPIFDNNRLLIYARTVPIDIRTAGGARVLIEQNAAVTVTSPAIKLGGDDAGQSVPQGENQKAAVEAFADAVQTFAGTLTANFSVTNPSGAASAFAALQAAVLALKASQYLSPVSKTK